jgi:hypothetical protein
MRGVDGPDTGLAAEGTVSSSVDSDRTDRTPEPRVPAHPEVARCEARARAPGIAPIRASESAQLAEELERA